MIIQIQFTLIRTVLQLDNIPSFLVALTGVVHVPLQVQNSAISLFHRNIYHKFEHIDFKALLLKWYTYHSLDCDLFFFDCVIVTVVISTADNLPVLNSTTPDHKFIVSQTHRHIYHCFENKYFLDFF